MFLTNDMIITPDIMCGMEIVNESERVWNKLELAMIKLEHHAIVNEDINLLNEGIGDFFDNVVDFFKTFGEKFMEFIRKVIIKWEEIQMKIQSKFLKRDLTIRNKGIMIGKITRDTIDVCNYLVTKRYSNNFRDSKNKVKMLQAIDDMHEQLNKIDKNNQGVEELNSSNMSQVIKFLKATRPQAVNELKAFRSCGVRMYNEAISEAKSKKDKEAVYDYKKGCSDFKKFVNEFISLINHGSVLALKAVKAASSASKNYASGYNNRVNKISDRYKKTYP